MESNTNEGEGMTESQEGLTKDALVGHYEIIDKIGASGMGGVYLAEVKSITGLALKSGTITGDRTTPPLKFQPPRMEAFWLTHYRLLDKLNNCIMRNSRENRAPTLRRLFDIEYLVGLAIIRKCYMILYWSSGK